MASCDDVGIKKECRHAIVARVDALPHRNEPAGEAVNVRPLRQESSGAEPFIKFKAMSAGKVDSDQGVSLSAWMRLHLIRIAEEVLARRRRVAVR